VLVVVAGLGGSGTIITWVTVSVGPGWGADVTIPGPGAVLRVFANPAPLATPRTAAARSARIAIVAGLAL